ncbi:FAD-binding oxidoreductase [Rubidibacter lacunae]|uniref:FAD-binding oxidoreductase n=1 Tax=Rubidibacter lacunae TaxID=582514 RepID=UPI00041E3DA8|nr:FAD-binding oxidoreductase [Rubidibacter lacunae]
MAAADAIASVFDDLVAAGAAECAVDALSCTVVPRSRAALSLVLERAQQKRLRVAIYGCGSKLTWVEPLNADVRLSTRALDCLVEHAVGDLTVTVEAGVRWTELQHVLAKTGQFVPLDPTYPDRATVGGVVATADSGSWRQRYGGVRDLAIGVEFVRADGQVAHAGGRVVKNVAGYDLTKLMVGSHGTLGAIALVTLRTYPLPDDSGTIALVGPADAIARAAQWLRGSALTPTAADLLSAGAVRALELGTSGQGIDLGLLVRFESVAASVAQQCERVAAVAQQLAVRAATFAGEGERDLWARLPLLIHPPSSGLAVTCKIGVLPAEAIAFLARLSAEKECGIVRAGSGLGRLYLASDDPIARLQELRAQCEAGCGYLSLLEAPAEVLQRIGRWGYTGNALPLMRRLKHQFDPDDLLNSGCFVGGI